MTPLPRDYPSTTRLTYVTRPRGLKVFAPTLRQLAGVELTVVDYAAPAHGQQLRRFAPLFQSLIGPRPPDVIVWESYGVYAVPLSWLARVRGIKNLSRVRGNIFVEIDEALQAATSPLTRGKLRLRRILARRMLQTSDLLLPVSTSIDEEVRRSANLRHAPSQTLHNPVNNTRFTPIAPDAVPALRHTLGLPPQAKIILTVTNFNFWAKVAPLLKFATLFAAPFDRSDVPIHWLIGGTGIYSARFQAELQEHSQGSAAVQMLGWLDSPERYFQAADLVLHFTGLEGFANVVLEAAACGRVVIGNDHPALREAVCHGETGILISEDDPALIRVTITQLLQDDALRRRMETQARNFVVDQFSEAAIAARFAAILQGLLKPDTPP